MSHMPGGALLGMWRLESGLEKGLAPPRSPSNSFESRTRLGSQVCTVNFA